MGLLDDGGAVPPVPDLPPVAHHLELEVLVDGAREDPRGALYEISDPGAATARVAGQGTNVSAPENDDMMWSEMWCQDSLWFQVTDSELPTLLVLLPRPPGGERRGEVEGGDRSLTGPGQEAEQEQGDGGRREESSQSPAHGVIPPTEE